MRNLESISRSLEIKRAGVATEVAYAWNRMYRQSMPRERFICYMVEMYHYVKNTCPLMELALEKSRQSMPALARYMKRHLVEESGHEQWVLNDLENLGLSRKAVIGSFPLRQTINLIGSQIYMINEYGPIYYLGYVYMMEGNTATVAQLDAISEDLGIDPSCMSACYMHAEIDIDHHIGELREWIELHVSQGHEMDAIQRNMQITSSNISELFLEISYMDERDLTSRLERLRFSPQ